MAVPIWPYDLCQVVISDGNYRVGREGDNIERTQMQSGVIRQKRKNTRARRVVAVRVDVPVANEEAFVDFIDEYGAVGVMFRKPNSQSLEEYRIPSGQVFLEKADDLMQWEEGGEVTFVRYLTGIVNLEAY